MNGVIKLDRAAVVQAYRVCREAELAIDAGLMVLWEGVLTHYTSARLASISELHEKLKAALASNSVQERPQRDSIGSRVQAPGLLRRLFASWLVGL